MHFRTVAALVVSLAAASTTVSFPLLHKRIITGTHAPEGEFPMFAQFDTCGGTVIGPQTILTAAHCLKNPKNYREVYLGGIGHKKGKLVKPIKVISHPDFNGSGYGSTFNDLGLAFLPEKVDGPYPSIEGTSYPEEGSKLTVAGYGSTNTEQYEPPEHLLKVQVTIGSHAECSEHRQTIDPFFNTTSQICAIDNGYSACNGDSGGPLYHGTGNDAQVVGLVRGGGGDPDNKCGVKGTYQYYTFIKPFIPWIKSEIEKFEQDGASSTTDIGADL